MQKTNPTTIKKNPQLWINIVEAKDLVSNPPNNPYCKIVLGKNVYRTPVMKNSTTPKWDYTFFVDNFDTSEKQILYMYVQKKSNLGKSHVYGQVTVDVSKMQPGDTIKEWGSLQNPNGKNGKGQSELGKLNFVLKLEDIEKGEVNANNVNQNTKTVDNEESPERAPKEPSNTTQNTTTPTVRSESPVRDLEEQDTGERDDSQDQKDVTTEKGSDDDEISDFAANIISNLQKEISELKMKLNEHEKEKRKSKNLKSKMTDFFKSNKDKVNVNSSKNSSLNLANGANAKASSKPSNPEIVEKDVVVVPSVTEEEEKAWLSKTPEFSIGNFFNSTEDERQIIIQDTFDATPLEIFKFIFSDNTDFFTKYHKEREDYNIKIGKWEDNETFEKKREIEFTAPLNFKIGPSKTHNWETQRYFLTKDRFVLAIYSRAPEIMFGKYFQVEALWEFMLIGEKKCQLTIHFGVPFSEYTVLKGTITKNAIKTYTDSHKMFIDLAKNELITCLAQFNSGGSSGGASQDKIESNGVQQAGSSTDSAAPKPVFHKPLSVANTQSDSGSKGGWLSESNFKLIYFSNILMWIFIFFILFFKK